MSLPTVLVDNTGRITRYDPVHPFFYRVRAAGYLAFLGSARGTPSAGRPGGEDVARVLEGQGWQKDAWQLLVLFPLRETGGDAGPLVAAGGMADKLYQLKEDILRHLSARHLEPVRTVAIFYDTVARNGATAEPLSGKERRRFQVDTLGYVREAGDFSPLFSDSDFQELDRVWPVPFDMEGCPTDRGLAGLPGEKSKGLEQACAAAQQVVETCVLHKKKAVAEYSDQSSSLFLSDSRLMAVQQRFSRELAGMLARQDISGFSSYLPVSHLKTIVREMYSVAGVTRHDALSVLRFPLSTTESELPRQVLSLAYLLLTLVEHGEDLQLTSGKVLRAEVIIDSDALRAELAAILSRWKNAGEQLQESLKSRPSPELWLIRGCQKEDRAGRPASLPQITIPPFLSREDWKRISENKSVEFNRFRDGNSAWLSVLYKRFARAQSGRPGKIDDPREFMHSLQQEEQACKQRLLDRPYGELAGPVSQWHKKIGLLGLEVDLFFRQKPSLLARLSLMACGFLLLATPPVALYLADNPLPELSALSIEQYGFLAGFALASMLPLPFLYLADRRLLRRLRVRAEELVRQTAHDLQEILEDNIEFLFNLCQLFVLRNNLDTLRSWLSDDETDRQCRRFFIEQLRAHGRLWRDVFQITPDTGRGEPDTVQPDLSRPPEQQPLFFVGGNRMSPFSYQIDNQGAVVEVASPDMPGTGKVIIRRDGVGGGRS